MRLDEIRIGDEVIINNNCCICFTNGNEKYVEGHHLGKVGTVKSIMKNNTIPINVEYHSEKPFKRGFWWHHPECLDHIGFDAKNIVRSVFNNKG